MDRLPSLVRRLGYRSYFRLVALNYQYRLVTRSNHTPAGSFRCYELVNRHGDDPMLATVSESCGPSDVVYDVGANVGIYALALAGDVPDRRVVAFEPSPQTASHLRANVEVNGLEDQIHVRAQGLGAESGEATFYVSTYPELSGFDRESATRWEATVADTVSVPVTTLDQVVREGPEPDVVKLDVEGAGPDVLAGGRDTLESVSPPLFIEVHEEGLSGKRMAEMRTLLEEVGYHIDEREGYWCCTVS